MENSKCFLHSSAVWAMGPCTRRRKRKELNTDRQGKMNKQKTRKGMRCEAISNTRAICFLHTWQGLSMYVSCWRKGTDISGYRPTQLPWVISKQQHFAAPEDLAQRDEVGEHITPKTENTSQPLFWSLSLIPEHTSFGRGCGKIPFNLKSHVWSFA